jgi:hypothetical protein
VRSSRPTTCWRGRRSDASRTEPAREDQVLIEGEEDVHWADEATLDFTESGHDQCGGDDVSWLSADKPSFDLAPGRATTVTVPRPWDHPTGQRRGR